MRLRGKKRNSAIFLKRGKFPRRSLIEFWEGLRIELLKDFRVPRDMREGEDLHAPLSSEKKRQWLHCHVFRTSRKRDNEKRQWWERGKRGKPRSLRDYNLIEWRDYDNLFSGGGKSIILFVGVLATRHFLQRHKPQQQQHFLFFIFNLVILLINLRKRVIKHLLKKTQ